jgi:hypothetical protein
MGRGLTLALVDANSPRQRERNLLAGRDCAVLVHHSERKARDDLRDSAGESHTRVQDIWVWALSAKRCCVEH